MFRAPRYLEKTEYIQFNLDTPLTFPGNGQHQVKTGKRFFVRDRNSVYDWYNAYFRVNFNFQTLADGANVAGDTRSAPINSAFSLLKSMTVKSAGKVLYEAVDIHKVIFIKNLLDYSDDYARSVAKSQFWYLDTDATDATAAAGTNAGSKARGALSHGGATVETIIPLNRFSFFEELSDRLLPPLQLEFEIVLQDDNEIIFQNDGTGRRIVVRKFELWVPQLTLTSEGQKMFNENFLKPTQWTYLKEVLHPSPSQRDASGSWLISAGVKKPKHVFIFFQQTRKQNSLTQNPYIFDTFDLDGEGTEKVFLTKNNASSQVHRVWYYKKPFSAGKLSVPSQAEGAGLLSSVGDTAAELFISKGIPYLAKQGFEAGRYYASEAMRNPALQKKAINYGMKKARPAIDKVGRELFDQLSTKIRPKGQYKTNRPDLDGAGFDLHSAIGKLPAPKRGWTLPGHNYTGPYNPLEQQLKYDPETGEILEIYQQPTGSTDAVAMQHDVDYSSCAFRKKKYNESEKDCKNDSIPWNKRQWGYALARNAINSKQKLGLGYKQRR